MGTNTGDTTGKVFLFDGKNQNFRVEIPYEPKNSIELYPLANVYIAFFYMRFVVSFPIKEMVDLSIVMWLRTRGYIP